MKLSEETQLVRKTVIQKWLKSLFELGSSLSFEQLTTTLTCASKNIKKRENMETVQRQTCFQRFEKKNPSNRKDYLYFHLNDKLILILVTLRKENHKITFSIKKRNKQQKCLLS